MTAKQLKFYLRRNCHVEISYRPRSFIVHNEISIGIDLMLATEGEGE